MAGGAIAVVLYVAVRDLNSDMYTPRPEAFELLANDREITVAYCGSTADTIAAQSVREGAEAVVVSVRLHQKRDMFQNGTVVKVTFQLKAPLGGRTVEDDAGAPIPSGLQYLCPG